MTTDWSYRLFDLVRADLNTPAIRQAYAEAFSNNSSGQSIAEERAPWESGGLTKWERVAAPGVVFAYSLNSAIKPAMRDWIFSDQELIDAGFPPRGGADSVHDLMDAEAIIQNLRNGHRLWVVYTNTAFGDYADGEVIYNRKAAQAGGVVTVEDINPNFNGREYDPADLLAYLLNNWGLQPLTVAG